MKVNIAQFTRLTGGEVSSCKKLPDAAFSLLSDQQIQTLDWSKFTAEQFARAMKGDGQAETVKRRLNLVSTENIAPFIERLPGDILENLPVSFFKSLQLSKLSQRDLVFLFPSERLAFIPFISPEEMAKGVHLLLPSQLEYVSDAQFAALNFATISQETLNTLLQKTERISLIPVEHLGKCIHHIYSTKIEYISDLQFAALNLTAVPTSMLNALLQKKTRIPQIPLASVRVCAAKVPGILEHLSPVQCQVLDVTHIAARDLQTLFPPFTMKTFLSDHTHTFNGKLHQFELKTTSARSFAAYTEDVLQKMLEEKKHLCISNMKKFTSRQIELMLPKLSPDVQQLYSEINS